MYSVIFVTGQSIILIVSHLSQESIILAVLHLCLRIVNYFHSQSPSDTGQSVIIIVTTICHRIVNHIPVHHKFNLKCSLSFSEQNRRELKKQQFYFSMVCLVCTKSITMHLNYTDFGCVFPHQEILSHGILILNADAEVGEGAPKLQRKVS